MLLDHSGKWTSNNRNILRKTAPFSDEPMTPARLRGSSCTTDIGSRTSGGIGINYIRNSFLPEISRSSIVRCETIKSTVYFDHGNPSNPFKPDQNLVLPRCIRQWRYLSWWTFQPWRSHDMTLHLHWVLLYKVSGERTRKTYPPNNYIDRNGAYMRTCSICNLFVASFARTHCPTSLLPSNTFSPRRPTLR